MSKIIKSGRPAETKPLDLASFERAARAIVEQARAEAAAMIEQARSRAVDEAEALREQARREGHKAGYEAGFEEGSQQGRQEAALQITSNTQSVLEVLTAIARELDARVEGLINEGQNNLAELALKIARKVIKVELTARPEQIAGANMARALELAAFSTQLACHVNSADAAFLEEFLDEVRATLEASRVIRVVPDDSVARGGVIVRSERGSVDAGIEAQLAEIERQLAQ